MSESTGRGPVAREPAADVSEEYLAAGRQAVRTKSTAFDGEIVDLIRAAREDLALGGVLPERAQDEEDPLIKRAVMNYIKAEFGLDNEDAEKFRTVYERLKVSLAMSSDYVGGGGVAVYWRDEAALIREEKRVKPNGYKETVKTRREVFANKKTATRSEFYTAKQAGDKIALVLEVRGADYQEETLVEYEGRLYEVVRAYTESGETYELNCKEAQEPPETAQEGPDEEGAG